MKPFGGKSIPASIWAYAAPLPTTLRSKIHVLLVLPLCVVVISTRSNDSFQTAAMLMLGPDSLGTVTCGSFDTSVAMACLLTFP